jgi:hypothetical protein
LAVFWFRPDIFLGFVAHFCKLLMILSLLLLQGEAAWGAFSVAPAVTAGLVAEISPFSWQGFGIGHLAFEMLLKENGADLYNCYFLGKTVFKLGGATIWIWLGKPTAGLAPRTEGSA